jgi:hypothetical protein
MFRKSEKWNHRLTIIGLAACLAAGLFGGIAMIDSTLTTAGMLMIFFGGMGAGASLANFVSQRKNKGES